MTTPAPTRHVFIVVRAAVQQQAENIAIEADPVAGRGTFVPGSPLRVDGDATNTVAAYWTRWHMTPAQESVVNSRLGAPLLVGEVPNIGKQVSSWFFAPEWSPDDVLAALGFALLAGE